VVTGRLVPDQTMYEFSVATSGVSIANTEYPE